MADGAIGVVGVVDSSDSSDSSEDAVLLESVSSWLEGEGGASKAANSAGRVSKSENFTVRLAIFLYRRSAIPQLVILSPLHEQLDLFSVAGVLGPLGLGEDGFPNGP